jgi:phage/plasmid-associated DNA primase
MASKNSQSLRPGEVKLSFIPFDWPLTPLNDKKAPYIQGWQNKPYSTKEIESEIQGGVCKAVGLLGGPVYNKPYGHVWVDIDGPTVYQLIEEISGLSLEKALPRTLTICSGKEGRERKLYTLDKEKWDHFSRNKYAWHASGAKEKLEILWKRHQGVLMGLHPETEGYFTKEDEGFEWVDKLPELPEWLLDGIINKNIKQGQPFEGTTRVIGPNFAISQRISIDTEIKKAKAAMWALPPEAADDYDIWITVGQSLHQLDESLLEEWDEWSKVSDKYQEGECFRRWQSFSKGGGRGIGSLIHLAQQHGWTPPQDHKVFPPDNETLDAVSQILKEMEDEFGLGAPPEVLEDKQVDNFESVPAAKVKDSAWFDGNDKAKKNVSADIVAEVLLQMYQGDLRYCPTADAFFIYGYRSGGLWSELNEIEIKGDIRHKLNQIKSTLLPKGYSMNLLNDVYMQLKIAVSFSDWYDDNAHLLFTNGVLDVSTREFGEFKKELYMTQLLPYDYDPHAECEEIVKWLKYTQEGDWGRVQVLRAWLRAVLLSCSDIQKFVEIVGPGKSGKSSFANLAHALVGHQNAAVSSLEYLEKNRFETSNLYQKKLLLFNDTERFGGNVSVLKAVTGRDLLRNEQKYQSGKQPAFKFKGLVMITANESIQTTDPTSGLARRRLTIPFNNQFRGSSKEQRVLIDMNDKGEAFGVFAPMLPGLVNWLLDMEHDEMKEYLMETDKKVPFFSAYQIEQGMKSNQLLYWMHHLIVYELNASSAIGFAKYAPPASDNTYVNNDKWLYASYCEFCRYSNANAIGRSRFESLILDVCNHQLGLNIYRTRNSRGMRLVNIAIRGGERMNDYPSIVELGFNKDKYREFYGGIQYEYKKNK